MKYEAMYRELIRARNVFISDSAKDKSRLQAELVLFEAELKLYKECYETTKSNKYSVLEDELNQKCLFKQQELESLADSVDEANKEIEILYKMIDKENK